MNPIEWEDYRVFLAVLRKGGFAAAAPGLGMVASTVRRRIERFETMIGQPVFVRDAKAPTLTPFGLRVKPMAEAMERSATLFAEAAVAERSAPRGAVRLLAAEMLGLVVLTPTVARLRRSHPEIRIDLILANALDGGVGQIDLAVSFAQPRPEGLTTETVGQVEFGLHGRRDLLDRLGRPASLEDLRRFPLIGSEKGGLASYLFSSATGAGVDARFDVRSESFAAQWAALKAGAGLAACQVPLAAREPDLERVLPDRGRSFPVHMIMHASQAEVMRVRVVRDAVLHDLRAYFDGA